MSKRTRIRGREYIVKEVQQEGWSCPFCDSGKHTYCTDKRCKCSQRHHMAKIIVEETRDL